MTADRRGTEPKREQERKADSLEEVTPGISCLRMSRNISWRKRKGGH